MPEELSHFEFADGCLELFGGCECGLFHHVDSVAMLITEKSTVAFGIVTFHDVALVELFDGEVLGRWLLAHSNLTNL